ncbi:MAG: hypothetical protein RBU37_11865 [Myxococcota bacterium]|nr:hypothetical protein [Myxococcota bacterium]
MSNELEQLRRRVKARDIDAAQTLACLARASANESDLLAAWSVLHPDRFFGWKAMRAALLSFSHSASSTTRSIDSTGNIRHDVIARTLVDSFRVKATPQTDPLAVLMAEIGAFLLRYRQDLRAKQRGFELAQVHRGLQSALGAEDDEAMLAALRELVELLETWRKQAS